MKSQSIIASKTEVEAAISSDGLVDFEMIDGTSYFLILQWGA